VSRPVDPLFSIVPDRERVWLFNSGPGIAFKTTWQFTQHEKFAGYVKAEPIGAIGINREVPLSFRVQAIHTAANMYGRG
jgi:hypothetical protein